ncbi:capsid and scaffold protein [Streptococcus phage Javan90]|uniref:DUF4355 domain-containing protein n=1 Tax=Streptococcus canis TaxID=1329 RepID=A0A3P5Y4L4_STRCB|nr:DUF4355 domain-containing protein [Streptococcus canis]QBX22579.1 capsid and scaffold protein [Streptococcus phage Javan87]QBX32017.1 capsid and scaffold protein [Streptococcus phage Javan90]VDC41834.1 hypothetical protein FMV2238Y02_02730 [Streptococcus canis]
MENEEILEQSGAQEEAKEQTFDDILSDPKKQAEFDKRVAKAIDTARNKWVAETEEKENEAKRLAKMNAEQKAQHEKAKLEARIAELEAERTLSEMKSTARTMLSEANINVSDALLSQLVSTDADKTKNAVEAFSEAFSEAVEKEVKERLKSPAPKKSNGNSGLTKEQILAVKDTAERQKLIAENIGLFQ